MKNHGKKFLIRGTGFIGVFALWTLFVKSIDVQNTGVMGTEVGFSALNNFCHRLTGVNMTLYNVTDWLGLVPVFVCICFGFFGFYQLIKRKSLFRVDIDIIFSGIYYILVIACYLVFEMIPINYRPVLINGVMEASYPSSTTLLVLSVMPVLSFQAECRLKNRKLKKFINVFVILFSAFMVIGRLVSGVHWLTDIIGSVFLSAGLFYVYKASVLISNKSLSEEFI